MHPEILARRSLTLHTEPTFIITDPCKVAERENWKERLIIKWNEKISYYLVFRNTAFLHKDFTSWIYVTWYAPVREGLRKTALLDEDNSCIRSDKAMSGHLPEKDAENGLRSTQMKYDLPPTFARVASSLKDSLHMADVIPSSTLVLFSRLK